MILAFVYESYMWPAYLLMGGMCLLIFVGVPWSIWSSRKESAEESKKRFKITIGNVKSEPMVYTNCQCPITYRWTIRFWADGKWIETSAPYVVEDWDP